MKPAKLTPPRRTPCAVRHSAALALVDQPVMLIESVSFGRHG
jgi:hypothetical protein